MSGRPYPKYLPPLAPSGPPPKSSELWDDDIDPVPDRPNLIPWRDQAREDRLGSGALAGQDAEAAAQVWAAAQGRTLRRIGADRSDLDAATHASLPVNWRAAPDFMLEPGGWPLEVKGGWDRWHLVVERLIVLARWQRFCGRTARLLLWSSASQTLWATDLHTIGILAFGGAEITHLDDRVTIVIREDDLRRCQVANAWDARKALQKRVEVRDAA